MHLSIFISLLLISIYTSQIIDTMHPLGERNHNFSFNQLREASIVPVKIQSVNGGEYLKRKAENLGVTFTTDKEAEGVTWGLLKEHIEDSVGWKLLSYKGDYLIIKNISDDSVHKQDFFDLLQTEKGNFRLRFVENQFLERASSTEIAISEISESKMNSKNHDFTILKLDNTKFTIENYCPLVYFVSYVYAHPENKEFCPEYLADSNIVGAFDCTDKENKSDNAAKFCFTPTKKGKYMITFPDKNYLTFKIKEQNDPRREFRELSKDGLVQQEVKQGIEAELEQLNHKYVKLIFNYPDYDKKIKTWSIVPTKSINSKLEEFFSFQLYDQDVNDYYRSLTIHNGN